MLYIVKFNTNLPTCDLESDNSALVVEYIHTSSYLHIVRSPARLNCVIRVGRQLTGDWPNRRRVDS